MFGAAIKRHRANRASRKRLKARTGDAKHWIRRVDSGEVVQPPLGTYVPGIGTPHVPGSGTSGYDLTDALKGPTRHMTSVQGDRPPRDHTYPGSNPGWEPVDHLAAGGTSDRPLMTLLAQRRAPGIPRRSE